MLATREGGADAAAGGDAGCTALAASAGEASAARFAVTDGAADGRALFAERAADGDENAVAVPVDGGTLTDGDAVDAPGRFAAADGVAADVEGAIAAEVFEAASSFAIRCARLSLCICSARVPLDIACAGAPLSVR